MANSTVALPPPKKRRRWLRGLAWLFCLLIVLLVAVYFVATSSAFLTGVILPRVGKTINANITVSEFSVHPFHEVILRNLKVQTTGDEPLLSAAEVRARYNLMDIIRGNIHVDEVALASPKVVLIENADGTSNLDPILKSQRPQAKEKPPEQPAKPSKPSKPPQLDLKKFALTDATIRKVKIYKTGSRDLTEISHVNVTLDDLKNGQTAKLQLGADINVENNPPTGTNGLLQAKVSGSFTLALSADLKPASINGNTRLEITRAQGAMADLAALGADLDCQVTPTDVKQVALRFQKGGTRLGELRVSGPFDMEKTEGRLAVQILAIDKQVLNLAGASSGVDFGTTTINSTNQIELAKAGSLITASGQLQVGTLELTRAKQTTPALDLRADYNVTVDRAANNALLRQFDITGTRKGNPLLRAELTSPMNVAWGNTANAVGDSTLNLTVSGLNLADWKPFLGDTVSTGEVNLKAKLLSQQGGKQLTFDLNSQIGNLTANLGTNRITEAGVTLEAHGKATEFKQFNLSEYKLELAQQNQPLLTVSGAGTYDAPSGSADMQIALQATLARLLHVMPQPDADITSGTVELKGRLTQKQQTQTIVGNLALADLTGKFGKNDFRSFSTAMDLDVSMTPQQVEIRKVAGKLAEGGNPGGSFDVSGTYDLSNKSAQVTARLTDFNQNGLRPFLEPLLADKKLVSVAINATASAQYNPQGDSAVKSDLQLANLVVRDPKQQFPATPLEAKMQIDTSLRKQVADVRQFQLQLTPTHRARNQVRLGGQLDMSQTNAKTGQLNLLADSRNLTSYYDLFAGETKTQEQKPAARAATAKAPPPPPSAEAAKEPEPTKLPFRNFTAEVNIGRLYLREIEVANFQMATKLDGGRVLLNPCKLAVNGAPVDADLDLELGVPGYKYAVAFGAKALPLTPFVNSFAPDRKDQINGTLTAQAKISGEGVTGPSLQKNLAGQFDISSTNLNLSVINVKSALLKTLINVIAAIPELVHNPVGAATSLVQGITGLGSGGLMDELKRSPIDAIVARGTAGSGRITLQQAVVQSPAFRADATGDIALAEVLTNSAINFPIGVSLSRSIAQRLNLVPSGTPPDAAYAKLPDFVLITGTLGKPKPDKTKLLVMGGGAVLKGVAGALPAVGGKVGGKVGGILEGVGGLLTGRQPASTNAPPDAATNPPSTGDSIRGILGPLFKPKKQ